MLPSVLWYSRTIYTHCEWQKWQLYPNVLASDTFVMWVEKAGVPYWILLWKLNKGDQMEGNQQGKGLQRMPGDSGWEAILPGPRAVKEESRQKLTLRKAKNSAKYLAWFSIQERKETSCSWDREKSLSWETLGTSFGSMEETWAWRQREKLQHETWNQQWHPLIPKNRNVSESWLMLHLTLAPHYWVGTLHLFSSLAVNPTTSVLAMLPKDPLCPNTWAHSAGPGPYSSHPPCPLPPIHSHSHPQALQLGGLGWQG